MLEMFKNLLDGSEMLGKCVVCDEYSVYIDGGMGVCMGCNGDEVIEDKGEFVRLYERFDCWEMSLKKLGSDDLDESWNMMLDEFNSYVKNVKCDLEVKFVWNREIVVLNGGFRFVLIWNDGDM